MASWFVHRKKEETERKNWEGGRERWRLVHWLKRGRFHVTKWSKRRFTVHNQTKLLYLIFMMQQFHLNGFIQPFIPSKFRNAIGRFWPFCHFIRKNEYKLPWKQFKSIEQLKQSDQNSSFFVFFSPFWCVIQTFCDNTIASMHLSALFSASTAFAAAVMGGGFFCRLSWHVYGGRAFWIIDQAEYVYTYSHWNKFICILGRWAGKR